MRARAHTWGPAVGASLAVALVAALATAASFAAAMVALALAAASVAAVVDLRERRIPDLWVAATAMPLVAVLAAEMMSGSGSAGLAAAAAGAALFAAPILLAHLVDPAAMGFGDVKLAAVLGATVGLADWRWSLVALCAASGVTAAVGIARGVRDLPFAPGLVAGAAFVHVIHAATGGVLLPWH